MQEVLFEIFGFEIYSYSFMMILGILCLAAVFLYRLRKVKVSETTIDRLFIVGGVAGLFTYLGASFFDSLWHAIGNAMVDGKFISSMFHFSFAEGGITFEGGLITGLIAFFILLPFGLKTDKRHALFYADQIIIGVLIAHSLGRVGCFLAGCCYGKETTSIFGMYYPTDYGWMKVYPTQLFEAIYLFISFIVFFFIIKKNHTEKYLISYGVFRFFLEYLRGDDRGQFIIPFLSPSQFMSLVMIVMGIICIIWRHKVYKKELDDESITPTVRYFSLNYKNFLKGLFKSCNCPECNKKLKIKTHSELYHDSKNELINLEHFVYYCKDCNKEYPIK